MKIIDIHSHLQFSEFDSDRDQIITDLKNRDWGTIVVGTNVESSQSAVDLAIQHEHLWATVGQHPTDESGFDTSIYRSMLGARHHIDKSKIVAIGECGFDFFRASREQEYDRQAKVFQGQVDLAAENQLPLMLHGRPTKGTMNAYEDILDILESRRGELPENPGNAHFFVGSMDITKRLLGLNFTCSFDGPITFARDYDEVIRYIPSNMIHGETDAPFAAPVPHRGQQNLPLYVDYVIQSLIDIRNEQNPEEFKVQLVENARRVFNLDL